VLSKLWTPLAKRAQPLTQELLETVKSAEWQLAPLLIPDREAHEWEETHPLEQMRWTWAKNARCNGHYVNVVKALKWWRRVKHPTPKYPKGYPVEHLIGASCPDGITSVAEGVTHTLESMASTYALDAALERTPVLPDHGVPSHDVLRRVSGSDFAAFHRQVADAAKLARTALDAEEVVTSAIKWRELFGDEFPEPPGNGNSGGSGPPGSADKGGFTARVQPTTVSSGRYA
jgi:hypothetical protein